MIRGLYETHLPVSNLERSIEFYRKLDLELAIRYPKIAFFWIEKGKSWIGLWENDAVSLSYHPSIRHFAFRVDFRDITKAIEWLKERGIQPRKDAPFEPEIPDEPTVRPDQANASVYFDDPDGNSLEFICNVPEDVPHSLPRMLYSEWQEHRRMK